MVYASGRAPTGSWHNPAGEFPDICMTFDENGVLRFSGGFEYYNPAHWKYEATAEEVTIVLGGKKAFPTKPAQDQLKNKQKSIIRFDPKNRELVFPLSKSTKSINFLTFIFYHEPCK